MSNFVTYNSSAGSGKTFTLVKEYLKIALENDNPNNYRQILAITFTNKAAAEMKERVLSALIALSSDKKLEGNPMHLLAALILPKTEGGLGLSKEVIKERSGKVLKSILHNYNDFGISTIDKFTHKVVRTFAHDLQLPMNFNIELEEEEVLKASIDVLMNEVGSNEKLTEVLTGYALQKSEEEKSWSVDRDLLDFAKKLLKDDGEQYLEKVRKLSMSDFEHIKQVIQKEVGQFENKVIGMAKEAVAYIASKGILSNSFSGSFYPNYWTKIINKMDVEPTDTTLKIINGERNWYSGKADAAQKQLIDECKEEFIQRFKASQEFIARYYSDYLVYKNLSNNLYNLAVLNELEKTLLEFKQENNILNISDFNKRIASIVSNEPAPFIYERLGEKYNHYLIDEFQDTSVMQWHNLLPLVDNSLAKGHFNMVVGDAKQAIYRWRGGEVEQLLNFPKVYQHNNNPILLERQDSLARNFVKENLEDNYRSKAEIVDFNNQFFNHVATNLSKEYQALYSDLNQGFEPNNTGGGVEINIFENTDNQLFKEYNLKYILNTIKKCQEDGYGWKDIAILTRGKEEGKVIASYLLSKDINVISAESLLLSSSAEVQFILSFLGYLSEPGNSIYQIKSLTYLANYTYQEELFEITQRHGKNPLLGYLNEKGFNIDLSQLNRLNLYELVEHLVTTFGLNQTMDIYIQFFLDKVHEYVSKNDHAIPNFLEWWEQRSSKFTIVIPDGVEAVQVMTIHKSKGLEFPVVIFPFADKLVKISESFFWTSDTAIDELDAAIVPMNKDLLETRFAEVYEKELEKSRLDTINIMYVAFTRPKDRLYVVTKTGNNPSKNGSMGDYLRQFCADQGQFDEEQSSLLLGAFSKNTVKEKDKKENKVFNDTISTNWRERLKISYQAPKVWEVENPQQIGEFGTLIHAILAKIEDASELGEVLDVFVIKGLLNNNERKQVETNITSMFANHEIKNLFENVDELKNERTILLPSGEAYQPDRVIVKENITYLVDFKTGSKEANHQKQLLNYRNLLSEMGYQNIKPMLLYVQEGELEPID